MGKFSFFSRLFKRKDKEELNKRQKPSKADPTALVTDKTVNEGDKNTNEIIDSPNQTPKVTSSKEDKSVQDTQQSEIGTQEKQTPFVASQLTIEDVDALSPDDSIAAFLAKGVSKEVKRAALDKLFQNPIFNIRDGLNEYDLDYSRPKKLTAENAAQLRHLGDKLVEKSKQYLAESNDPPLSSDASDLVSSDEKQKEDEQPYYTDAKKALKKDALAEKNQLGQITKSDEALKAPLTSLKGGSEKNKS